MMEKREKKMDPNRVGFGKIAAWSTRSMSLASITIVIAFMMQFCTDTLGMAPALVGTIMLVSKISDGITDLICAYIIENTHTRFGKGRPYEFCIIGAWLSTILLFYASPEWSDTAKIIWVFTMYTLIFSIFSTLMGPSIVPYMVRAFDNNPIKVAKVGSYSALLMMIGVGAVQVTFPIMMQRLAVNHNAPAWRVLITMFGVPLALIGLLRFFFVKEDPKFDESVGTVKISLRDILHAYQKNKYCWFFALVLGAYNLGMGFAAGSYYFTYIVGNIGLQGTVMMVSMVTLPVMLVFPALLKKFSPCNLMMYSAGFATVGYIILFFAKANLPMLMAGTAFMGMAQFPVAYLQGNVIMQLADYTEFIGLPRMESGLGIAAQALSKIGSGGGSALLGIILAASGYSGSAATQTEGTLMTIRILYSFAPMVCMILMAVSTLGMRSLDKMGPTITAALKEKREKALASAAQS
jgi:Na+/melibiose symporter-like transporter